MQAVLSHENFCHFLILSPSIIPSSSHFFQIHLHSSTSIHDLKSQSTDTPSMKPHLQRPPKAKSKSVEPPRFNSYPVVVVVARRHAIHPSIPSSDLPKRRRQCFRPRFRFARLFPEAEPNNRLCSRKGVFCLHFFSELDQLGVSMECFRWGGNQ